MSGTVFARTDERLGQFAVRPVDAAADASMLWRWLTHPKSAFWQMGDASVSDIQRQYRTMSASPGHDAFVGLHEQQPAFLFERYDPATDPLGQAYPVRRGDVGMHFLVAPSAEPVHGFTHAVLETIMAMLFSDPATARVVVEPDVANEAVHWRNAAVGFRVRATVSLPDKRALLCTCTRAQYRACRESTGGTA